MEVKRDGIMRNFIAIEYPGKVNNAERMVETLGGIEELSKGFEEKQKLQLTFRPNFYAKPILSSEPNETTGMLLKVKVRKSKKHPEIEPECVSADLLGTVSTVYKFNNFADYQYLPIQKNAKTGKSENIYNDIVPGDITVGPSWFRDNLDVPVFLPPSAFTRSDTMQPTILKNEVKDSNDDTEDAKFAITNRSSRTTNGISVPFNMIDSVPTKCLDAVKDIVNTTLVTQEDFDEVCKLFQQRPIWTLASLRAYMRNPPRRLNYILAGVAFYYSTGPWRNCFVLFGYDPRVNFESRLYQMLDYRVRQAAGFKGDVSKRRSTGGNKRVKVPTKFESGMLQEDHQIDDDHQRRRKEAIFTNDTIPPFRARHYQFVDIHIPKIQDMLQKIPSPLSGALCNWKRGWLPDGFMEQCRDILTEIAQANMLKHCAEKNITFEDFKAIEDDKSETQLGEEEEQDSDESDSQFAE